MPFLKLGIRLSPFKELLLTLPDILCSVCDILARFLVVRHLTFAFGVFLTWFITCWTHDVLGFEQIRRFENPSRLLRGLYWFLYIFWPLLVLTPLSNRFRCDLTGFLDFLYLLTYFFTGSSMLWLPV